MAMIDPIQQEAMRRVNAMQSRIPKHQDARRNTSDSAPHSIPQSRLQSEQPKGQETPAVTPVKPPRQSPGQNQQTAPITAEQPQTPVQRESAQTAAVSPRDPVEILFENKEQNIILMLILLLAGDGTEPYLILALLYLLI